MNFKALPKIDLHCHLDGSVRPETLHELAIERNINVPEIEALRTSLIAPEDCPSLDEYLKRFDLANQVMQDEASIERITFEVYEDAALENIKYLEVRFGPLLHVLKDLSIDQVIQSVLRGMHQAEEKYDIKGGIILSVLRTMNTHRVNELLEIGAKYLDKGVVAFDLASSEVADFASKFKPFADYAKSLGYKITIHAGETGIGQNVLEAIEMLHAERIGHGIHIKGHKGAYDAVKTGEVVLEVCPTSNVQTKAVPSMSEHPVNEFYQDDLLVSINTDNRTVSNTNMSKEVERVFNTFNLTMTDYKVIYTNSVKRAFTTDEVKQDLMSRIETL